MFVRATTLLALASVFAELVVATPPACVIGAISKAQNPRDISSICGSPDSYKQYLAQNCGSNQQTAIKYFAGICSDAGVTVSTDLPSSSSSSKSVPSSTGSSTSGAPSASVTSESNSSVYSSSASSGSSSATTTGGSSSNPTGTLSTSIVIVSATASVPVASTAASASARPSTGFATRMGVDAVGLAAVGVFGAMLAL